MPRAVVAYGMQGEGSEPFCPHASQNGVGSIHRGLAANAVACHPRAGEGVGPPPRGSAVISFHILKQKENQIFSAAEQIEVFCDKEASKCLLCAGGQPQPCFPAVSPSVWVLPALGSDPGPQQGDGAAGPCWCLSSMASSKDPFLLPTTVPWEGRC